MRPRFALRPDATKIGVVREAKGAFHGMPVLLALLLAHDLVRALADDEFVHRQFRSPLAAARREHPAAVLGRHSLAEAMLAKPRDALRLPCSLDHSCPPNQ